MKSEKKAEEIAAQRVQLLSPLLAAGLDAAKISAIKAAICEQSGLSERTLRRYLAEYREHGFSGLKPKERGRKPEASSIPTALLDEAILLRREVPSLSVSQIIQILVWERKAKPGELKRSTLQEKLAQSGYSSRQMRLYESKGIAARRFQKRYRNALWQSDIKYGPHLPIGPGGEKKQAFLVLFVDDIRAIKVKSLIRSIKIESPIRAIKVKCLRRLIKIKSPIRAIKVKILRRLIKTKSLIRAIKVKSLRRSIKIKSLIRAIKVKSYIILSVDRGSQELRITPFSRFGAFAPRSARCISKKRIQANTPARLTALRAAGSGDGFAYPHHHLKSFGVVNTRTLCETLERALKNKGDRK